MNRSNCGNDNKLRKILRYMLNRFITSHHLIYEFFNKAYYSTLQMCAIHQLNVVH